MIYEKCQPKAKITGFYEQTSKDDAVHIGLLVESIENGRSIVDCIRHIGNETKEEYLIRIHNFLNYISYVSINTTDAESLIPVVKEDGKKTKLCEDRQSIVSLLPRSVAVA